VKRPLCETETVDVTGGREKLHIAFIMCTFYQVLYYYSGWIMEDVLVGACRVWYGKRQNSYTVLVGKFEDSVPLVNLGVDVWKILKSRKSAQDVNILNYVGEVPRSNLHCPPRTHMQILCHGLQFYNYCFLPVIYILLLTFKHLSPIRGTDSLLQNVTCTYECI